MEDLPAELCAHVAAHTNASTVVRMHAVSRHWNDALRLNAQHVWHTLLLKDFPRMLHILAVQRLPHVRARTLYLEQRRAARQDPLWYLPTPVPSKAPPVTLTDFLFTFELEAVVARRMLNEEGVVVGMCVRTEAFCTTCSLEVVSQYGQLMTTLPIVPSDVCVRDILKSTAYVTRNGFTRCLCRATNAFYEIDDDHCWTCGEVTIPDAAPTRMQYADAVRTGLIHEGEHYYGLFELEASLVLVPSGKIAWDMVSFHGPSAPFGEYRELPEFSEYGPIFLDRLRLLTCR